MPHIRNESIADTIGTVPVPWIFSNKIYGSNFIKQHAETFMV